MSYAKNDPANHADPEGQWVPLVVAAVGASIGAAISGGIEAKMGGTPLQIAASSVEGGICGAAGAVSGLAAVGVSVGANLVKQGIEIVGGDSKGMNWSSFFLSGFSGWVSPVVTKSLTGGLKDALLDSSAASMKQGNVLKNWGEKAAERADKAWSGGLVNGEKYMKTLQDKSSDFMERSIQSFQESATEKAKALGYGALTETPTGKLVEEGVNSILPAEKDENK